MGKIYHTKKGCGCKLCKPQKGGWEDKKKPQERALQNEAEKEMSQARKK